MAAWVGVAQRLAEVPATFGVIVCDADTGEELFAAAPDAWLRSASVAKILLLIEVARRIEAGTLPADEPLTRDGVAPVADSGIWQHLSVPALAVADLARLVGAASDNLATNVLLDRVGGVAAVARTARAAGIHGVVLHDIVRDQRMPGHPPALSTGTAAGYADLMQRLWRGEVVDPAVSARVLDWLGGGFDLSMVAAPFALDPLAHAPTGGGLSVINKTGTDAGVRADVAVASGPRRTVVYACIANWSADVGTDAGRVLDAMGAIGRALRAELEGG